MARTGKKDLVNTLLEIVLKAAAQSGADTWDKISGTAPRQFKKYVEEVAELAVDRAKGEISEEFARSHTRAARITLYQAMAYTTQVTLVEAQDFIDAVLDGTKGALNKALPVAIL